MRVRVATYNVQSFRGGMEAVRDVLAAEHPDVVLLQECRSRRATERLARLLRMQTVTSHRRFRRPRNAVLFSPPWRLGGFEIRDLPRAGRTMRRGLIAVQLRQAGTPLTAVSAHLGLSGRERAIHARDLTDFLGGVDGPVVVGADLNEGPEGPAARWISERLYDAVATIGREGGATFPAAAPTARIDYLFVSGGVQVLFARAADSEASTRASDHRPVLAEIEIEER